MNQKELDYDLEQDLKAEKELDSIPDAEIIKKIMCFIEDKRKVLCKSEKENGITRELNKYTQKQTAEKAGISLSTYKRYLSGDCAGLQLIVFLNLTTALRLDGSKIIESVREKSNSNSK